MNKLSGQTIVEDCENTALSSDDNHLVAALGLKDTAVIHSDKLTLVYPIKKQNLIKEFVLRNIASQLSAEDLEVIFRNIDSNVIDI